MSIATGKGTAIINNKQLLPNVVNSVNGASGDITGIATADNVVNSVNGNTGVITGIATNDNVVNSVNGQTGVITGIATNDNVVNSVNGQQGIVDLGPIIPYAVAPASYNFTWDDIVAYTPQTVIPRFVHINSSGVDINITGATVPVNQYQIDIPSFFIGTNGGILNIYDVNYDASAPTDNKQRVILSSFNAPVAVIRRLKAESVYYHQTCRANYIYHLNTNFTQHTVAQYFWDIRTSTFVYIGGPIAYSTDASLVSGLFNLANGARVLYKGAIPTYMNPPVANTKYININTGAILTITTAWAINASNITTDGTATVIVAGKQIIPTF